MEVFALIETNITFAFPNGKGRLAQLVQSTSFTPRGSGVRIPQRPHKAVRNGCLFLCPIPMINALNEG